MYLVGSVPGPWEVNLVLRGEPGPGGVPGLWGVYLVLGGVPGPGSVPGPRVYLPGDVYLVVGGGCFWLGGVPAQVLPPPCGQNDRHV